MRVDLLPPAIPPPATPLRPGAALPDLSALRAAPPPARSAGLGFAGQLVESLMQSLAGSAAPPGPLQLQLQWQAPGSAYAPPLPPLPQPAASGNTPPPPPATVPPAAAGTPAPLTPDPPPPPLPGPPAAAPLPPTTTAPLPLTLPGVMAASAATTSPLAAEAPLSLQAQLPVITADGQRLSANLQLSLLPTLRREFPEVARQLETALAAGSALPLLRSEGPAEALAGQVLQFTWFDPRALWPLQSLAMRGLLRFATLAEERDRERERRRARQQALRESEKELPPRTPPPAPADDGGPPRIAPELWLWHSLRSFLRWLRQQL